MDPLMGGILSLGGGIVQQLFGRQSTKDAQSFAAQQAANQTAFQERMANSAWQRGMADMKAGGLNPILAYQKGPASSPTGAMASTSAQQIQDVVTPAISTARQGQRVNAEVENMVQQNANLKAQETFTRAQTATQGAQLANITQDTLMKQATLQRLIKEGEVADLESDVYKRFPWLRDVSVFGRELGTAVGAAAGGLGAGLVGKKLMQGGPNITVKPSTMGSHYDAVRGTDFGR